MPAQPTGYTPRLPPVSRRTRASRGALHQVERALAGVGSAEYDQILRQSFQDAEAVLVLNPITAAMLEPFARHVRVVPWGIDPARFSSPVDDDDSAACETKTVTTLFMAAVAGETIKGFHVAQEACRILRETRSDFELVVTFDPPDQIDEITRSIGWCSQAELPKHYQAADIVLVPTIAQDALEYYVGRSDGRRQTRHREPDRRVAVYRHRRPDGIAVRSRQPIGPGREDRAPAR